MSHGYYHEGDGPGTDDPAISEHEQGCDCSECQYQREQMFQDLREEQEAAAQWKGLTPDTIRSMEIIAADHQVTPDDYSHRLWMAYVIQYHRHPTDPGNPTSPPCIIPKEESQ